MAVHVCIPSHRQELPTGTGLAARCVAPELQSRGRCVIEYVNARWDVHQTSVHPHGRRAYRHGRCVVVCDYNDCPSMSERFQDIGE